MRRIAFVFAAVLAACSAGTQEGDTVVVTQASDTGSLVVSVTLNDSVTTATAVEIKLAPAGAVTTVTVTAAALVQSFDNLAPGAQTVSVRALDGAKALDTAEAAAEIAAGKAAGVAVTLGDEVTPEEPVVPTPVLTSLTATNTSPLTQEVVTLTASATGAGASPVFAWSDDCKGDFLASSGAAATWRTTWAETCRVTVRVGNGAASASQSITLTSGYRTGTVATVAGTGFCNPVYAGSGGTEVIPFVGAGGPATAAAFSHPYGMLRGPNGNLYFSDRFGNRVHMLRVTDGTIHVVAGLLAGNASGSDAAMGAPATSVAIYKPWGLAQDALGNVWIAEYGATKLRKVYAGSNTMTTFEIGVYPMGIDFDLAGNLLVVDGHSHTRNLVRFYPGTGTTMVLKSLALEAFDIDVRNSDGQIFVANRFDHVVTKVHPTTFAETILAGQLGVESSTGYQIPATLATLDEPMGVFAAPTNKTFIAERGGGGIRVVGPAGNIKRIVGQHLNYAPGLVGLQNATPALQPTDMVLDAAGDLYFSDRGDCTIKKAEGPF